MLTQALVELPEQIAQDEQEWECITSRQDGQLGWRGANLPGQGFFLDPRSNKSDWEVDFVELRDRQRQLTELEALVEDWSSKHRALQVDDPGCEEKLSEAQNTLGPLLEIWSACATFLEVLTYCGETEISMLDEERAAKCQEMAEQFEDLPPVCLCEELQTRCEILQEVLSIARMLEDFQEAHWEQMEGSVDKWNIQTVKDIQSRLESSDSLLLEDLVALKLLNVREELQAT
ncbi:unnamed protein product [Effrenium voratum]|nr:unnamed protein product [Effrenium voratum]